MHTKAKNL